MFLDIPLSEEILKKKIEALMTKKVSLKLNNNRTTYLSFFKKRKEIHLSLHKMFLFAKDDVLSQIAAYILNPGKKAPFSQVRKFVNTYITNHQKTRILSTGSLKTTGKIFDLEMIYKRINQMFFDNKISIFITWAKKKKYRVYRHITYGTYDPLYQLVSINPLLDNICVPYYFIAFIVYHEMLHHVVPARIDSSGKKWVHTKEFKKRERQFIHYERAKDFQKKFVEKVIYGRT